MEEFFKTLAGEGRTEIIVKRSRFLAAAVPAYTAGEAQALLSSVRKEQPDASHHVWAYALRDGGRRYSDDGEPSAGLPILNLLEKRGLADCAVVVTRYFGGTLLGAGGLARAYSQAAAGALDAAGTAEMTLCRLLRLRCDYGIYGKLQRLLPANAAVLDTRFGEGVTLALRLRAGEDGVFIAQLAEAGGGKIVWEALGEEYAKL